MFVKNEMLHICENAILRSYKYNISLLMSKIILYKDVCL